MESLSLVINPFGVFFHEVAVVNVRADLSLTCHALVLSMGNQEPGALHDLGNLKRLVVALVSGQQSWLR